MMLRVHLLCETDRFGNPHGSGQIRLLRPFSHPVLAESFRMSSGAEFPRDGVDVVLVERGWRADATLQSAEALVTEIRKIGAKLIYTLDDNLLDLHRGQPWHEFSTDVKRNIVRYFLCKADGVVVSTEPLQRRVGKLNPNVAVVPNALDERLFLGDEDIPLPPVARDDGKLIVGYMGTHSHLNDLLMVLEPLRAVLRAYQGKVEFQMVGISEDNRIIQCFDALPLKVLDTAGNHFYPNFIPWAKRNLMWDLAIAPLEDSQFTSSKSDIKFLDYALLGVPGIYSNVESYKHTVEQGKTGILADNSPRCWKEALTAMLENQCARSDMARAARVYVEGKRILKHCAVNWKDVIIKVAEKTKLN
ncbi:MAG: hypothetical protein KGZ83_01945 [Sulfuricella sp.]|nr:hypothetical protein [Sulfuricella sp.]